MSQTLPVPKEPTYRPSTEFTTLDLAGPLDLGENSTSYTNQYSSIYFVRLGALRKPLEKAAKEKWSNVPGLGKPTYVKRVLDVVKGKFCYIIGTLYIDMPMKPSILEDIGRDDWIAAPAPRELYVSENDTIMLEDESGRIKLSGEKIAIENSMVVTGVIVAILGAETSTGGFEVADYCFAGMSIQKSLKDSQEEEDGMDVDAKGEWIALVSGLDIGRPVPEDGPPEDTSDLERQLLVEYLTSEAGGEEDQDYSSQISRLLIVGNSVVPVILEDEVEDTGKFKRFTPASKTKFSPVPLQTLTSILTDVGRALPVHLMPGPNDPTGSTLPQQAMPRAMFGRELGDKRKDFFFCETNPTWIGVGKCEILASSGQNLDDIFKYFKSEDRLAMARQTILWRHMAPTAPDTLWCYPYIDGDPFIMKRVPHIYIIGNQPKFETEFLEGDNGQVCRIILLPRFKDERLLVLVHTGTLEVKTVEFGVGQ